MKLLIYGHHSHTGFGVVTENIGGRLVELGVDVRVIAVNHRGEPVQGRLAGRVWPARLYGDGFGGDWSGQAIDGSAWPSIEPGDFWNPDAVLVISDVSGLIGHIGPARNLEAWKSVPVYHYCPIEGDNLSPSWRELWAMFRPVAMSDYGARVIEEHIGRPVPRIYHGVDTDTFRPVSLGDPIRFDGGTFRTKDDCKAKFGLEGKHVIFRADRNVVRKNFHAMLRAFVPIAQADPLATMVLHCRPIDPEGIDLWQELLRLPEDIRPRVKFTMAHDTFKGMPVEGLVVLYNAADVYMSTTGGEGFGLTLAEALSCGTPVVCTGWAAEREVVAEGGVLIDPLHDRYGEPVRYHSTYGMDWAVPDPVAFAEPVLNLLAHPKRARALGAAGRLHVKRTFSWDTAAAEFLDLLSSPVAEAAA